jgi:arylsulfatase
MQKLFMSEAEKYNVFPLDNRVVERVIAPRPSTSAGRSVFTYSGEEVQIPHGSAPSLLNRSYQITADLIIPANGAEGMLVTQGGRFGGYGFYLQKSKPVFVQNLADVERTRWQGPSAIAPGKHRVSFDFKYDGGGVGKGGTGTLKIDNQSILSKRVTRTTPIIFQWDEPFTIGVDTGTPVDDNDYQVPFRFTGKITQLKVELGPVTLTADETRQMKMNGGRNNSASE